MHPVNQRCAGERLRLQSCAEPAACDFFIVGHYGAFWGKDRLNWLWPSPRCVSAHFISSPIQKTAVETIFSRWEILGDSGNSAYRGVKLRKIDAAANCQRASRLADHSASASPPLPLPAALRARVTNGATTFGQTRIADQKRGKSFFARDVFHPR